FSCYVAPPNLHSFPPRRSSDLTGDASLRRRPMRRVTEPLRAMGAEIKEARGDALPLSIRGGRLHALTYTSPVASARRGSRAAARSEEHTSELQSRGHLVCRLLL